MRVRSWHFIFLAGIFSANVYSNDGGKDAAWSGSFTLLVESARNLISSKLTAEYSSVNCAE